jgi:hypothetical protein
MSNPGLPNTFKWQKIFTKLHDHGSTPPSNMIMAPALQQPQEQNSVHHITASKARCLPHESTHYSAHSTVHTTSPHAQHSPRHITQNTTQCTPHSSKHNTVHTILQQLHQFLWSKCTCHKEPPVAAGGAAPCSILGTTGQTGCRTSPTTTVPWIAPSISRRLEAEGRGRMPPSVWWSIARETRGSTVGCRRVLGSKSTSQQEVGRAALI